MDLRGRFCKYEDWHFHRAKLSLLVLTLGLFIGINILDRGFKIDVWTNIPYSFITNSIFINGMSIEQVSFNIPPGIDNFLGNYIWTSI